MFKSTKKFTSIFLSKFCKNTILLLHYSGGTSLPGKIALKLYPEILSALVNQSKNEIISITGTNGKTTTSGFVSKILEADGRKIAHNRKGANMLTGIATAMTESCSITGKLDVDHCLLEVDEAYLSKTVDYFNPEYLLVTNLFRDQLDRYGELDATAKKIQTAIDKTSAHKKLKLFLNADDPMVSGLKGNENTEKIYYGFDEIKFVNQDDNVKSPQEVVNCPCGEKFKYSKIFYGHLGHYYCNCGNMRSTPKINAKVEISPESSKLLIKHANHAEFEITIAMPGLYNAYNALAAASIGLELGISPEVIKKGLERYDTVFGRAELLTLKEKPVLIQLIKNPIGATEVLRTVKDDKNSKLLIIINDNYADGKDVSWLWDANFELLSQHDKEIITSGIRASDMAVRLKYAGINSKQIKIIEDIKTAVIEAVESVNNDEKLYILPTYTALLEIQKFIGKLKT